MALSRTEHQGFQLPQLGYSKSHGYGMAYSFHGRKYWRFLSVLLHHEIWDVVDVAYSDLEDYSQVFELRNRIRDFKQGDTTVTQFFNTIKKLWQEVDLFNRVKWKYPDDSILYRKMVARELSIRFFGKLES